MTISKWILSFILASLFLLTACGDPDIAIRPSALRLSTLFERAVLKLENVGWLYSDPMIGPCKGNFEPKYCQSVTSMGTERHRSGQYLFKFRFPVGPNCTQLADRLSSYRADPARLRELIDTAALDVAHLKMIKNTPPSLSETRFKSANRQFDPEGGFFILQDDMETIRELKVDCSNGTIDLMLHCRSCWW